MIEQWFYHTFLFNSNSTNRYCNSRSRIWENYGNIRRSDIPDNASEQWMQYIQDMCDAVDFPMEDVVRTIYKDKNDEVMQEVQDIQKHLIPCRENAFLFNKRLK